MDNNELNAVLSPEQDINLTENEVHIKSITKIGTRIFRRSVDIVAGLFGVLLLIPIIAIVYIVNIINKQHGKILFIQERIGLNGKTFKMYKFRTMVENADEVLKDMLENDEELRKEYKKYKKLKNDPRITKMGKILRRTSLDEFPQFINILKGEMTLVGPRPYLEREKEDMGEAYNVIINCKPGLTGKWQVTGRSGVTFQDRVDMDVEYCNNRTLREDIKIFFKTIIKTIIKDGAI